MAEPGTGRTAVTAADLQAHVTQVTVQKDRSVRLGLVMTNEGGWHPRAYLGELLPLVETGQGRVLVSLG